VDNVNNLLCGDTDLKKIEIGRRNWSSMMILHSQYFFYLNNLRFQLEWIFIDSQFRGNEKIIQHTRVCMYIYIYIYIFFVKLIIHS
jgi:hypothetical protein